MVRWRRNVFSNNHCDDKYSNDDDNWDNADNRFLMRHLCDKNEIEPAFKIAKRLVMVKRAAKCKNINTLQTGTQRKN